MIRPHPILAFVLSYAAATLPLAARPAHEANSVRAETAPDTSPEESGAISIQREWWTAFTHADMAQLQLRTTDSISLTLSSGKIFNRNSMLAQAATQTKGKDVAINWSEEAVRFLTPTIAVVTSRVTEGDRASAFRYLTVLHQIGNDWKVTAAQSTRELVITPRVAVTVAGPLSDYAGDYLTPQGGVLRVVVRDSKLGLIEPSGLEIPFRANRSGAFRIG